VIKMVLLRLVESFCRLLTQSKWILHISVMLH